MNLLFTVNDFFKLKLLLCNPLDVADLMFNFFFFQKLALRKHLLCFQRFSFHHYIFSPALKKKKKICLMLKQLCARFTFKIVFFFIALMHICT